MRALIRGYISSTRVGNSSISYAGTETAHITHAKDQQLAAQNACRGRVPFRVDTFFVPLAIFGMSPYS